MLKNKTKIIIIFLTLILLLSVTVVFANNETSDNGIMPISDNISIEETTNSIEDISANARLQEESYKKSDVYLTGKNVTIDYIVDGNLFVFADTVTINSQIGGDAFVFAKNLIINEEAYVFSNLFTISNSVEIKGVVYDVFALAQNLTISKGYVYRDIKVSCDTLNINGTVGRNAFVNCSNIKFNTDENTNGIIHGNLNYSSNSEISIPENVVTGEIKYSQIDTIHEKSIQSIISNYILNLGSFIAFVTIIWLICLIIAPKFLNNTHSYVGKKTLSTLCYGLLTLVIIPVACIILILLQLTSGISLVLLALYILAIIISKSLFTITANNYICSKLNINKTLGTFGMLIIAAIIIWILTQVPYIGTIISFIITTLGLGILVYSILPKKCTKNTDNEKTNTLKKEKHD